MDVLEKRRLIVAPGVYNAMGSQIAKQIGFDAVYGSGWAVSAMNWALPDMGFHDLTMMSLIGKHIVASAHPLPVILDAETGFGTETTLARTVEVYHTIGVALAHLEDQDSEVTRRCGNLGGKKCVPPEKMVAKIRSWLAVSKALGTSMRLMVRTDALTASNGGLEDAIERGKRFMDVEYQGLRPTVLWADAMMDPKVIDRWIEEMHKHDPNMILGINYSPNKDWTGYYSAKYNRKPPTYNELYRGGNGFRLIWHTILQARADMEATWNTFAEMAVYGAEALWNLHERQRNHPVGDSQGMSNAKLWQAYEQHIGGEEARERYEKSEGYKG
jgi:2-methylisocitrate lyase-like PEP mutase family enzyme